jgi:hypothetical protein
MVVNADVGAGLGKLELETAVEGVINRGTACLNACICWSCTYGGSSNGSTYIRACSASIRGSHAGQGRAFGKVA